MRKYLQRPSFISSVVLAATLSANPVQGASIGIVNGDFEADAADNVAPPSGWTDNSASASFWTGVLDESGNPTAAEGALAPAPGLGSYILTTARTSAGVGSQPVDAQLTQTVDLSAFGAAIDAGDQVLNVDFIYSSNDGRDTGVFSLHFFGSTDGSGAELGAGYLVNLDADNGYAFTGWFEETAGGLVPIGARSVTLQIDTTRTGGSETNVWIDNITGDINTIPEPASLALLGLGGATLLTRRNQA